MKTRILFCFIVFTFWFGIKKADAQLTYTWVGGTSGSWTSAANWSLFGITNVAYPGEFSPFISNDVAIINTSNATISYNSNLTIGNLQSANYGVSGIIINFTGTTPILAVGGGISVAQPSSPATGLTFSGTGTATIAGTAAFSYQAGFAILTGATVTFTGTVNLNQSNGTVPNAGTLNCSGCTVNSTGNFTNTGTINATAGGTFSFSGTPSSITNTGSINVSSGTLTFGNNSNYLQNSIGGTVTCNSATINLSGSHAYLTNSGTFKATGTAFTFGNDNYIQNNSGASFTTQTSCTFGLTTSSSYITNSGTWKDHTSTYTLSGQGTNIQNTGAGATMNINGTTINFSTSSGNNTQILNNTATFMADSASTINAASFKSGITNTGTFYAGVSGSACVIHLTGQSTSVTNNYTSPTPATFYLGSTSIIYPSGVTAAITNTSPSYFILQSDANGSAAFGPFNTTVGSLATCTGTFNVERFFQGSTTYDNVKKRWVGRNYRIISSPVHIVTAANGNVFGLNYIVGATAGQTTAASSTTNAFITGATGGNTIAGNPSIYLYRESITPNNATFTSGNFLGITNITNSSSPVTAPVALEGTITASDGGTYTLPIGTGVLFFFRGAATSWATRTVSPFIIPDNVTLTSTGNINYGSYTYKDWYTPAAATLGYTGSGAGTNFAVRGFNMVGNPYPCSIDWNTINTGGITATHINPTIYMFDPVTNQYDSYKSTGASSGTGNPTTTNSIIVSGQGFFVQGNALSPALVITEAAKSATSQLTSGNLLMGTPVAQSPSQLLRLRLIIDTLNYDDIVIGFNSNASAKYDGLEDAEYLPGINAMEGLSSISSDSIALAMNFLPLPKQSPQVIKLDVEGRVSGQYTFQKTALDAIPQIYQIWLMDSYKKDSLDLRNNSTYIFNIDLTDTNSYGKNRFQLVIRQNPELAIHLLNFTAVKSTDGAEAIWKTENEQNYTNFTVERSTDGGTIFAALGGFASSALGSYSFLDKNPLVGADKYRLKIEDMNGVISHSNIVTLVYGNSDGTIPSNISVYPNPASSVLNLAISQNSSNQSPGLSALQKLSLTPGIKPSAESPSFGIKIISTTGSVIKSATSSQPTWQDNISSLVPGTYIIQVVNNGDNSVVGKSTFVKL